MRPCSRWPAKAPPSSWRRGPSRAPTRPSRRSRRRYRPPLSSSFTSTLPTCRMSCKRRGHSPPSTTVSTFSSTMLVTSRTKSRSGFQTPNVFRNLRRPVFNNEGWVRERVSDELRRPFRVDARADPVPVARREPAHRQRFVHSS